MFKDRFMNVCRDQLNDFDFLCEMIKSHEVQQLVKIFLCMSATGQKHDEHVLCEAMMDISMLEDEIISISKEKSRVPVAEIAWSKRASHWNWVREVKSNLDEYIWVYSLLCDDWSKETFHRILLCRFLLDYSCLYPTYRPIAYYDWDVLEKKESVVLVDCGAYDGNSVLDFIERYGNNYKRIYAYEPTPKSFHKMEKSTVSHKNIVLRNSGVGEYDGILKFHSNSEASNFIIWDNPEFASISVPVVSLDNDIEMPVSFIKMDIEGSEMNALRGAKCHIVYDKPQLAICVYHLLEDLRTIPRLIHSYNKNQKFYMRNHEEGLAGELVFYADPF